MIYASTNQRSPGLEIKKETGITYREQIVGLVNHRKQLSETHFAGIRTNWPRLYDLWRGTWTGRFHPHRNNVHIPLIFSAIWADAARKAATSLNMWPIVTFLGYGPDDMATARKRESLVSAQMKDDDVFLKQVDFIVGADLYGKGIMQVGWKFKQEERIIEYIDKLPLSGRVVKSIKKGKIVSFDGPITEGLDLLDCFPQPNVKRLRDMAWFIRRYFLDLDEVRYLTSLGTFDKSELARLEREGSVNYQSTEQQSMIRRFAVRAGMDDESVRWMDKYSRPIELYEYWGVVPSELSPDGVTWRKIVVANGRYLLANRPNPFWHNQIPFVDFSPTPDPHYFFAPGKAEIVEKLQIVGNRYLNQSLDAADLLIDPMWFYDRGAMINTKNLYSRPGKWIGTDGNPNNVIAPMKADYSGLTVADNKIAQVREFTQMGTGIVDDAVQGLGGTDRQTAREFIGRREAAGTRLLLESSIYEKSCLEPMADMFVMLDKQFLEAPVEILIMGDGASVDPVTGEPIPGSRETLTDYDLVPNYAARAIGATSALSKGMKQERLIQLLQALNSPIGQVAISQINSVNFFRGIFREFEVPNINEIFMKTAPLNQMVQNAIPGGDLSQVPTSGQLAMGGGDLQIPGMGAPAGQDLQNTLPAMA